MEKRKSEDEPEIKKKKRTSDSTDFESSVGIIFPCDTEISLCNFRKKFPKEKFCNKIPPLIFVHQLFNKHNVNPTKVHEDIERLKKSNKIKLLSVTPELNLVFFVDDLKDVVYSQFNPTGRSKKFLDRVVPSLDSCDIDKNVLKHEYKFSDKDITELVQFGLLIINQENTYTVSFPAFGQFMKTFYDGRKALINMIKKSKYKELLVSDIKDRALKPFEMLGLDYHLSDVLGAKLVVRWYLIDIAISFPQEINLILSSKLWTEIHMEAVFKQSGHHGKYQGVLDNLCSTNPTML